MAYLTKAQYNATNVSVPFKVLDSTDGTPETGYAYNTAGVDFWYRRGPTGAVTTITEATQTVTGAHSDGGLVHVQDGVGRLDLPDAAVASGVDYVEYGGTFTGMVVVGGRVELESQSEAAVRRYREYLFAESTLGASASHSTTVVDMTGILDAQTPANAVVGVLYAIRDATDGRIEYVHATALTATTLLMTVERVDDRGVMSFTPASGDDIWPVGIAFANTMRINNAGVVGDGNSVPWDGE